MCSEQHSDDNYEIVEVFLWECDDDEMMSASSKKQDMNGNDVSVFSDEYN